MCCEFYFHLLNFNSRYKSKKKLIQLYFKNTLYLFGLCLSLLFDHVERKNQSEIQNVFVSFQKLKKISKILHKYCRLCKVKCPVGRSFFKICYMCLNGSHTVESCSIVLIVIAHTQ